MLIKSNQNGIYEKVVRAKNGQLFRVQFTVVNEGGVLRGHMLSMSPILELSTNALSKVGVFSSDHSASSTLSAIFLPTSVEKDILESVVRFFDTTPFSKHAPLDFFMSQPTRAPSFN